MFLCGRRMNEDQWEVVWMEPRLHVYFTLTHRIGPNEMESSIWPEIWRFGESAG